MKYKVGDIVKVKPVEYFTDVAIQREGTMSIDESIDYKGDKKSLGFYANCWSVANPDNPELDADFDFHFTQLHCCGKQAIVLNVVEDDVSFGDRVEAELNGEMILNPTITYYILSIGANLTFSSWMLELVKAR